MKIRLLTIVIVFLFSGLNYVNGQTQLINPNLEGGFELGASITVNGWTSVQATTNTWRSSSVPVPFAGNNAAFISATSGADYVYNTGAYQTSHFYRDVTVPAGQNLITLTFQYKNPGENLFDRLLVYTAPTTVFPNPNEPLSNLTDIIGANLVYTDPANVLAYTQVSLELPQTLAGTTFRLIFTWQNDNMDGSGIPVAIDNIGLTSQVSNFGLPLNGFYTINNLFPTSLSIPNPGSNFNNFSDAISYLNNYGIAGDVRFDVASGQTFSHTPLTITRTGTAVDTIGFIKAGSGANPVIEFSGGTTAADAGLTLNGVDYISIDGINLFPSNSPGTSAQNIEYALRLNNATATNGSQFNKVRNLTITHNQLYTQNIAIIQTSTAAPTSLAGTNSNNLYQNITINNAFNGVRINSNATNRDEFVEVRNCQLGTSGPGSLGGASSSYGIYYVNAKDAIIRGNTIANFTAPGGSGGVMDGIYVSNSLGLSEISGNTIRGIRSSSTTLTCVVSGIRCVVASGGSANVFNNFVSDLSTALSTVNSVILLKGLSIQPLTAVPATSILNVDFNNVSIDGTTCANVSNACLEVIQTGPTVNIRNNILANFTTGQTGTPFHFGLVVPNLTIAAAGSISNRNDIFLSDGVNGALVRKTTATATNYASLPLWNTASGQDVSSISVNPEFTNNQSNLHVLSSSLDGTASMTGITWVNVDIDGQLRSMTPDIGADEFSLIQNDISFIDFVSPVFDDCFTQQEGVVIRVRNLAYLAHDFIANPLSIQLTVAGPVPTVLNIIISNNSLNGGLPLGSLAFLEIPVGSIDMSAYGMYTLSCQLNATGDQNAGNNLSANYNLENAPAFSLPIQVPFTTFGGNDLSTAYPGWVESSTPQPVTGSSSWSISNNLQSQGNVTASINFNVGNPQSLIIGPKISTAFNTFVSFDLALTNTSSVIGNGAFDSDDSLSLLVSTDCGFTYSELLVFDQGDLLGNQLTNVEYFLGAFAGQDIILAFKANDGLSNGTPYNLHLDNINIYNSTEERLEILAVVSPVQNSCYSTDENITVRVKNTGFVTIDLTQLPIDLAAQLSGPNPLILTESFSSGTLPIGAETDLTFTTPVDMTLPGVYTYTINASITSSSGLYEDSSTVWFYGQNPNPVLLYEDTACLLTSVDFTLTDPINGVTDIVLPVFQYSSLPVALPDAPSPGIDIPLIVSGSGGYAAQLLSVEIDSVVHANVTQLKFELIAPNGSSILLTQLNSGLAPGFYSTSFSMLAVNNIQNASAPYTGVFVPQESFNLLTGPVNGTWHLRVTDIASGVTGILYKWSLSLLQGNSVASYSWSSQNTMLNSSFLSASELVENDSYIVYSVTDAMGCSAIDSAQIIFPVFTDAPVLIDPLCFGDSNGAITSNVTGGFGAIDFSWATGQIDNSLGNLAAGTYTLDVTDDYGCTEQYLYTLSEPSALVVSGTATPITCTGCSSDVTISASGGTPPYTGTGMFTETIAGAYTYEVVDANGCSANVQVTVDDFSGLDALTTDQIRVYPNPFTQDFEVMIDPQQLTDIRFFDAQSKEVRITVVHTDKGLKISTDRITSGIYFLKIIVNEQQTEVVRIIKD
jgi:hypothetical protein